MLPIVTLLSAWNDPSAEEKLNAARFAKSTVLAVIEVPAGMAESEPFPVFQTTPAKLIVVADARSAPAGVVVIAPRTLNASDPGTGVAIATPGATISATPAQTAALRSHEDIEDVISPNLGYMCAAQPTRRPPLEGIIPLTDV
ncbi:MAG: hypothetical protein HIU82_00150 [Proteobacteria bacterium]|nr:hypothetical protein [Pseudomonadota bacterium]